MISRSFHAGAAASLCIAVLAVLPLAGAAESSGGAVGGRAAVTLQYRYDRNALASSQGARDAYRRLVKLARRACAYSSASSAHLKAVDEQCAAELVGKVIRRIGSARLAGQHDGDRSARVARLP